MPFIPKAPASCDHLDLALVERTLTKHYGDITAAARELGVSGPDLRRLTWAKPELLEEALLQCQVFADLAFGVMIKALDSENPRKREWAAGKILSSRIAWNHPLSPARR
jgi:hypothetical protein